ncbi:transposase [Enterococcus durans]
MYAPYVSLVKKLFPNAQLIIDRFHIVQHRQNFLETSSERNHCTT